MIYYRRQFLAKLNWPIRLLFSFIRARNSTKIEKYLWTHLGSAIFREKIVRILWVSGINNNFLGQGAKFSSATKHHIKFFREAKTRTYKNEEPFGKKSSKEQKMVRSQKMPPYIKLTLVVLCAYVLWTINHPEISDSLSARRVRNFNPNLQRLRGQMGQIRNRF